MIGFNHLGQHGRLGNQMFQYAALRGIAAARGYDFAIPQSNFEDEYSVLIDADGQEVRILEHERGEVILPDTLTYNSFDFLTEYDETPQEKVDNILT